MFRIDTTDAVATRPTPAAAGTPGYFSEGNPGTGQLATVVTQDWANMMQEEIMSVIVGAGLTPSKTNIAQLLQAIPLVTRGRLVDHIRKEYTAYWSVPSSLWVDISGFSQSITNASGNVLVRAFVRVEALLHACMYSAYFRLVIGGGEYPLETVVDNCHIDGQGTDHLGFHAILQADIPLSQNTTYTLQVQGRRSVNETGTDPIRINASEDYLTTADPDAKSLLTLMSFSV